MTDPFDVLDTPAEIRRELVKRRDAYIREKIPTARQSEYEENGEGWVLDKPLKAQVWMRKPKTHDVAFEDRVWAMCARMGFTVLSRDRNLRIPYGKLDNEKKQVDVLAADDEVVLVVECKSSEAEQAPTLQFKSEVESIAGYREGLIGVIREQFPDTRLSLRLPPTTSTLRKAPWSGLRAPRSLTSMRKLSTTTTSLQTTSARRRSSNSSGISSTVSRSVQWITPCQRFRGRWAARLLLVRHRARSAPQDRLRSAP